MRLDHPALPPAVSRPWVLAAGLVELTSLIVSGSRSAIFLAPIAVMWLVLRGKPVVAGLVTSAAITAMISAVPLAPLPDGAIDAVGVMMTDVIDGRFGPYALVRLDDGPILADLPDHVAVSRGDHVAFEGTIAGEPGEIGGRRHRGTVRVAELEVVSGPSSPFLVLGNAMRDRVTRRLAPADHGRGLLAGFLIGDTDGVDPIDKDAMRRSGLSHFTAVSGSNVALFLTVLFILIGPIGVGPRRRAVVGLIALPVFAAATRFEPSVLRASVMAGLVLAGRLVGIAMDMWQVLSTALIGLLLLDPSLAYSAGFQLSIAATAGVMIGAKWPMSDGARAGRALAVTIGAQVAVAPILLAHFGSVPLLSPLANLVAAPIVTAATVLGVLGTIGPVWFVALAAWLAEAVLAVARVAAGWPQVGWPVLVMVLSAAYVGIRWSRLKSPIAVAGAALVAVLLIGGGETAPSPGVVVLDVGQGDAILIAGGEGQYALVDGGPDPVVLVDALRRYGVNQLRLVVLTHAHADHAAGLAGLVGRIPIAAMWADIEPHGTTETFELIRMLEADGVAVRRPKVGEEFTLGRLGLRVEGPLRHYASPNDQSVVVMVGGPERSMLLSGDIEDVAQAELGHLEADVLKVPHHGSATSDPEWLTSVGAELSVISVGPNDFGHPDEGVMKTLIDDGGIVLRTDIMGDVAVPLG